jgi:membrane protein DedA with SNARE-associated domain
MLESFLDWLARLPAAPTYLVLATLSAVENVFPPVPADTAVALGAFLARRGEVSVVPMTLLCWLANVGGAAWTYSLGRRHAEIFRTGWGGRLVPGDAFRALESAYRKWGIAAVMVCRLLPGFRAAVTPAAGILGLPAGRTLLATAAASAVWYAFLAGAGYALAENWESIQSLIGSTNRVLGLLAAAVVVAIVIWAWRRRRQGPPPADGSASLPPPR